MRMIKIIFKSKVVSTFSLLLFSLDRLLLLTTLRLHLHASEIFAQTSRRFFHFSNLCSIFWGFRAPETQKICLRFSRILCVSGARKPKKILHTLVKWKNLRDVIANFLTHVDKAGIRMYRHAFLYGTALYE